MCKRLLKLCHLFHDNLLHLIVHDILVGMQLYNRFIKFLKSLYAISNYCVQLCDRLTIEGIF